MIVAAYKPDVLSLSILTRASWRSLLHHPWQMGLSILGVALGVTVVIAVDLASSSAGRAFERSMQLVAGSATHQLTGGPEGLPDSLYSALKKTPGLPPMAPAVQGYLTIRGENRRTMMLLGLSAGFRGYRDSLATKGFTVHDMGPAPASVADLRQLLQ